MAHSTAHAMKLASRFFSTQSTLYPLTYGFPMLAPPLPLLTNFVLFLCILFWHMRMQYFSFCVCVISPNINSRYIHCLQMKDFFFFLKPIICVCSFNYGLLGCSCVLVTGNNAISNRV